MESRSELADGSKGRTVFNVKLNIAIIFYYISMLLAETLISVLGSGFVVAGRITMQIL